MHAHGLAAEPKKCLERCKQTHDAARPGIARKSMRLDLKDVRGRNLLWSNVADQANDRAKIAHVYGRGFRCQLPFMPEIDPEVRNKVGDVHLPPSINTLDIRNL